MSNRWMSPKSIFETHSKKVLRFDGCAFKKVRQTDERLLLHSAMTFLWLSLSSLRDLNSSHLILHHVLWDRAGCRSGNMASVPIWDGESAIVFNPTSQYGINSCGVCVVRGTVLNARYVLFPNDGSGGLYSNWTAPVTLPDLCLMFGTQVTFPIPPSGIPSGTIWLEHLDQGRTVRDLWADYTLPDSYEEPGIPEPPTISPTPSSTWSTPFLIAVSIGCSALVAIVIIAIILYTAKKTQSSPVSSRQEDLIQNE